MRSAVSRCLTQIGRCHARIARKRLACTFDRHCARLEHVAVVRDLQRRARILLDQQDRNPVCAKRGDDAEDLRAR